MSLEIPVGIGTGVGVTLGLVIHMIRQQRANQQMSTVLRTALLSAESLSLPELVACASLSDGFRNRGKILMVLNPMVASGEVAQYEPPGATMRNRLSVLRFSLRLVPPKSDI